MNTNSDRTSSRIVLLFAALLGVAGCQRPFVEPSRPEFEILEPDLSTVFANATITLAVRASSFRDIARVDINGDTLLFDEDAQQWVGDYTLQNGFNRLVVSVTDTDGLTARDTAYAVHDRLTLNRTAPSLPEGRGGHTATFLPDGTLLVTGGATRAAGEALHDAVYWPFNTDTFHSVADLMVAARTGHTATLLPDGRVLLLGGSRRDQSADVEDLVEAVEMFVPHTRTFEPVPFRGSPVRRTLHTATLHRDGGRTFIDLYGGQGDVSYEPTPSFGTRSDLRRFEFRNDSLIALSPAPGADLDVAISGHTQTELEPFQAAEEKRYLIAGSFFAADVEEDLSFILDYSARSSVDQRPVDALRTNRARHASVLLADGFVGTFGGRGSTFIEVLNRPEIYSEEAERSFIYPQTNVLLRTYGLTATKLPNQRILLLGGFLPSGQSTATSAIVWPPNL